MGRVNKIGKENGVGTSKQLSFMQQSYSKLTEKLEDDLNKIKLYNININVENMKSEYPINKNGYFGKEGNSSKVRVINSSNPIVESSKFFNLISKGYLKFKEHGNAKIAYLPDGTVVTYRVITKTSATGKSPAVDINIKKTNITAKIKNQKIHFEEVK